MPEHKKTLALISIGQSPRTDDIAKVLSQWFSVTERGLLDSYSLEEAESLFGPKKEEAILRPRMREGRPALIAARRIDEMMETAVREAGTQGFDIVLPFCISAFPDYECGTIFIKPFDVCKHFLLAAAKGRRVGIVMPDPRMEKTLPEEFPELDHVSFSVNPHLPDEEMEKTLQDMEIPDADLYFLNCASFNQADKEIFRRITGKPVVLARSVLEKALEELA